MSYDVFISYSHANLEIAEKICSALESNGVHCWYAPRNIQPGKIWIDEIMDAIETVKLMTIIITDESIHSKQVEKEINCAADAGIIMLPFRLTSSPLSKIMKYQFAGLHWLNASDKPIDDSINELILTVKSVLNIKTGIESSKPIELDVENTSKNNNEQTEIVELSQIPHMRIYPAYQFYAKLEYINKNAEACFCFAALTIIDWLKTRLGNTDLIPSSIITLPSAEHFAEINISGLPTISMKAGVTLDIISLPDEKCWALRLDEPDISSIPERCAVPGRLFSTNVGLHILDETQVEIGVQINVTDPEGVTELPFAFRPGFIRSLFKKENVVLLQSSLLPYRQALHFEDDSGYETLKTIIENQSNTLPTVIFTEALKIISPDSDFLSQSADNLDKKLLPFRIPVPKTYYPFDPDDFSFQAIGFALTCAASNRIHDLLSHYIKKDYNPGDIIFVEPKQFGKNIRIINMDEADALQKCITLSRTYSKHRKYPFSSLVFATEARNIINKKQIDTIRQSSVLESAEKVKELDNLVQTLIKDNDSKAKKIEELTQQNLTEYDHGMEAGLALCDDISQDNEELKKSIYQLKSRIYQLELNNTRTQNYKSIVETYRNMDSMPQTNADIISYFSSVFGDHIAFTDRGRKTAIKSAIRPKILWHYLFHIANSLWELYHDNSHDIEKSFYLATRIDVSIREGHLNHDDTTIMATREDNYQGKNICAEAHIRISSKNNIQGQCIYYCYDHEFDLIIISSVGERLPTVTTKYIP